MVCQSYLERAREDYDKNPKSLTLSAIGGVLPYNQNIIRQSIPKNF